jgi:HK97 family phage major capsid protein
MKTLAQLREELAAAREQAAELRGKATGADATAEDRAAYSAAVKAMRETLDLIKVMEDEEALDAKTVKPLAPAAGIGHNHPPAPFAMPKQSVPAEAKTLLGVAALTKSAIIARATGERVDPIKLLEDEGYGEYVQEQKGKALRQMQKAGVFSTVSSNVLLPQPVTGEILPILQPETTFLQGNPRRVQLTGGVFRQPRGVGSSTAAYVAEGAKKPVGAPTFGDMTLRAHKLAGIVYMTNEAQKWPVIDLEAYIRQDLRTVLGLKMDSAMYFGTGTGSTPTGIFNQAGITNLAATYTNPLRPTIGELDMLANNLMLTMTAANIARTGRWRWVMGYRTLGYLTTLRDGLGNAIYPTVEANGTWKGIPILVSNQVPENGGATTDEGTLGLVDFSHVVFAEEEGMVMKASTEASIDDGGTIVYLWQQNMSAVLAEMSHDVGLDNVKAVAKTTVRWGA